MGPDGVGEVAVDDGIGLKPRKLHVELTVPARIGRGVAAMEEDTQREKHVRELWTCSHRAGTDRELATCQKATVYSERSCFGSDGPAGYPLRSCRIRSRLFA